MWKPVRPGHRGGPWSYMLDAVSQRDEARFRAASRLQRHQRRGRPGTDPTKGLDGIAQFRKAMRSIRQPGSIEPKPTLGVVSGLYELFPDNGMVSRSLAGLAAAIPAGGHLIYTGQPWHPQLELIARALTSHRQGQAWIMRRRVQAEMDQLVAAAGFRKIEQRIDEWGIFTVSVAERIAS